MTLVCLATLLQTPATLAQDNADRAKARSPISISLAGTWAFRLDPNHVGETDRWYSGSLPGHIILPGSTDTAGYGAPAPSAGLIGLTRRHAYIGPAWYQKTINVPNSWSGKDIRLFLERAHWKTTLWIDGQKIGSQDSLSAPHSYDLGMQVTPGIHLLTICVDNTLEYDLGGFASSVYEYTQTNWNGLLGKLFLEARDPLQIQSVQAYPNMQDKQVAVKVDVNNATGHPVKAVLSISIPKNATEKVSENVDATLMPGASVLSLALPMGDHFKPWDEFSPALYTLRATLKSTDTIDRKDVAFGMRALGARGAQFLWNGRPIFLRGTLECAIFPKTGYPPTDIAAWTRICRILKSYGLNCLRFHSWCPPDAAFTAADREGVYLQVEAPQANVDVGADLKRGQFIQQETLRILSTYGNHPSFAFFTMGNELVGNNAIFADWVELCRTTDTRHLYCSSTNGVETDNRDFTVDMRARGISGEGTTNDFRDAVQGLSTPLVTHEMGQWAVYPNLAEARKYDGVLAPMNFDQIRADLKAKHLLDQAPKFFAATGRQAVDLYKEEIEQILRTPKAGGFHLLDLHDYPGQGTATVGILDPFWDSKGLISAADFAGFAGPAVPLLRIPKRTYTANETLAGTVEVANYGPADLDRAEVKWSVRTKNGAAIASGSFPKSTLPTGALTVVGSLHLPLVSISAPSELMITATVNGDKIHNSWRVWVYPNQSFYRTPSDIVITSDWSVAAATLNAGGKVLFRTAGVHIPSSVPSNYTPVFWSPVWFPNGPTTMSILCDPHHPAFDQFPTEYYSNWQWRDLMQGSRAIVMDDLPETLHPIVQVVDNFDRNHHLGALFEARVGQGRIVVSSLNLWDEGAKRSAPAQLLHSIYAYMDSPRFHPQNDLSFEAIGKLLTIRPSQMEILKAKIDRADSEAAGYSAVNLLDGDPDTFWHSEWQNGVPAFPHEFVVKFPSAVEMAGFKVQQRQDQANGYIKSYAVFVSEDGGQWGDAVAQGDLEQSLNVQQINFTKPVSGKFVRFVALSSGAGADFCSLAEFEVIPR
ncbi:beta-galactosidase [Capsulimonas corticalis]|uniref:Beta-galactosidase n=1 Tax=Capsulimonas corticalis TaxID=2219043 RepID=A0A9N7Q9A1_9BACT|nr:beta-galactosidase [Capsulimonas corticalis]